MKELSFELINTHPNPDSVVIWLHGLGANGHDFVPIVPELSLPSDLKVRFIFPHSPSIPVTINGGMVMPAWYDILSMSFEREIDTGQIMASAQAIQNLIDQQIKSGIDSGRIILAGFSQGGAVAYQVALSAGMPLAGLMCMSTYFATLDDITFSDANKKLPICIYHGTQDDVVAEALGVKAYDALKNLEYRVEYKNYVMAHSVCTDQVGDISNFIQQCLV